MSYTLQLDGAKHTLGTVLSAIPIIAGSLMVAPIDVMPSQYEDMRVDRIQLQIVTNSPIRDVVPFDGPRWVELEDGQGAIDVGPYGDGQGQVLYRLFGENSTYSGHIAGNQGSGKSACANGIAISARASERCVIVYLDGAPEGGSSPFLAQFADFSAHGSEGAAKVLAIVESWADWRSKENVDLGWRAGSPRPASARTAGDHRRGARDLRHPRHGRRVARPGPDRPETRHRPVDPVPGPGRGRLRQQPRPPQAPGGLEPVDLPHQRHDREELRARPGAGRPLATPPIPGYGVVGAQSLGSRIAPFRAAYTKAWSDYADLPRVDLDEVCHLAADLADDNAGYWSRRNEVQRLHRAQVTADLAALRAGTWSRNTTSAATRPRPESAPPAG
uniref:hypothetical protein n=1 Tax=Saccharothrix espanaensis TaxID=103731 RepID=UPI003F4956F8